MKNSAVWVVMELCNGVPNWMEGTIHKTRKAARENMNDLKEYERLYPDSHIDGKYSYEVVKIVR